jgi:hypothetical protein
LQQHPNGLVDGAVHILNADNSISTTTLHG